MCALQRNLYQQLITYYFEESSIAGHRVGVDLAHVPPPVRFFGVANVKTPSTMTAMCHGDPMILRDNVSSDREDRLCVHSQPRHLQNKVYQLYCMLDAFVAVLSRSIGQISVKDHLLEYMLYHKQERVLRKVI